jgi:hypothetical protein
MDRPCSTRDGDEKHTYKVLIAELKWKRPSEDPGIDVRIVLKRHLKEVR